MSHPARRRPFSLRVSVLAAAVVALAGTAAAAPALPELAAAIDAPRVGAAVKLDGPIALGRGTISPAAGTAVRLLTAAGEPVGLLVDGPAAFRYVVEDRFSVPVARRNVRRASALQASEEGGRLVVSQQLRQAVVWDRRLARSIAGSAAGGGEGAGGALPGWAAEILQQATFSLPSTELLWSAGSGAGESTYALLDGERKDLLLSVDPAAAVEGLFGLGELTARTVLLSGRRIGFVLAMQPIGRAWWDPAPQPLVAVHTELDVDNPEGRQVTVKSRTTLRAERDGVTVWRARLADQITDGERLLPVTLGSVAVDGRPAAAVHQTGDLLVDLGRTLRKGETVVVEVVDSGPLAVRPNNDSYWSLGTWSWYPAPLLGAQLSTFEIRARVPAPFVPFATGNTVERTSEGKHNVVTARLDKPSRFPVVVAGKYHLYEEAHGGVEATVASYAFGNERASKVLAGLFFSAADVFRQFFGTPYPFDQMDVVEINDWGFGQAPPGLIFITKEAYNPLSSETSRFYSQGINGRFVHEVAHTWWGQLVKWGSYEEQWLSESFAEYASALALEVMLGDKKGEREFKKTLREWKSRAEQVADGGSLYLANHLAGEAEQDSWDRTFLLYNKGPYVLHGLRQELGRKAGSAEKGDKQFQALLRAMQTNFTHGHGETRHLVGILDQITGGDWQPWFERYVYGTETPPVAL